MSYYFAAFKKYSVFKGRATRSEYWYFTLFNILAVGLFGLIDQLMGTFNFDAGYGPLSAIYTLAMILPGLGVSIRRLHDTGRSAWWFLITAIPVLGLLVFFYFAFLDSDPDSNDYGLSPKWNYTIQNIPH
ncbi:DUF805 domain-containing protein [Methylicorpusculum oleiharenae]|uniref:DUF805 domain-containing protein n=1 Tax=Methylicorpusculum oleiharenae TaxID=1338687 RepID=UPI0013569C9A|nr:DUF805 domain-containing protein [Methylicorpusculum oleiharenae]MCD2453615.1 DUF805 domain-containing protein [Methylicorpusculum oleiharenae]